MAVYQDTVYADTAHNNYILLDHHLPPVYMAPTNIIQNRPCIYVMAVSVVNMVHPCIQQDVNVQKSSSGYYLANLLL